MTIVDEKYIGWSYLLSIMAVGIPLFLRSLGMTQQNEQMEKLFVNLIRRIPSDVW
jgi:hypothetical protein